MPEELENSDNKRAAFPYYSLEKCLEVALAVHDLGGGRTEVPKDSLAHQMGTDANAASFAQLIGSARAFNLIEGRGSYILSPLAKQHFMPTDDGQDREALLRAVTAPRVFGELVARFDGGKLPAPEILANILRREYDVSTSWSPRIASLFVGALKFAGAVDSAGFVRYASTLHQIEREAKQTRGFTRNSESPAKDVPPEAVPPSTTAPAPAAVPTRHNPGEETNVWVFSLGGASVRLETSRNLSFELWQKLNQYVQVLKPAGGDA